MALISTLWADWIWLAGGLLSLTTVLVAIVYMLSEFFQDNKMKSWAKMEFAEIFYSAILISLAITGLPLIDAVVQGALLGPGITPGASNASSCLDAGNTWFFVPLVDTGKYNLMSSQRYACMDICGDTIALDTNSIYYGVESCHVRLGMWYLREVFDETKNFAFDTYLSYIGTSMMAEFTINIEFIFEKAGFFTFTPWRGFYTMGNKIKEITFDWAMKLMMLTKFQEVLLKFIAIALFPAFFVIGAVLRVFPFTRKLGGLMLAMAIALYFIFPAFYAFGALVMLDIKKDPDVRAAWLADDANPAIRSANPADDPTEYPDPPIANTMYLKQNVTSFGPGGIYTSDEAQEALRSLEGMSSEDYIKAMETGKLSTGEVLTTTIDLSSTKYSSATDEEKQNALEVAYNRTREWFGAVSAENKLDSYVDFAFEPDGPLDILARLTFWSAFFALFSILGTIAGIRSLSITFGGDIEIAGLTRLI